MTGASFRHGWTARRGADLAFAPLSCLALAPVSQHPHDRMSDSESADPHSPSPTGDGQDTEPRDADGHEVARRGDTEAMEGLLEQGMDPNHTNEHGHSLLMIAAYSDQPEMADLLIEHGADPNRSDPSGSTPLMGCCFKGLAEAAEVLIEAGADVNATGARGATALMYAATYGESALVDLLLEHGADPTTTNEQGQTAAEQAAAEGHEEIAERLRQATAGA